MEFKGTKGEWYVKNGQICSSIYCGEHQLALRASSKPEARANIVLMSKSPEMLEMLKEANKVIEWYMENAKPDDNHTDFFNIGMNQRTQIEELIQSATTI